MRFPMRSTVLSADMFHRTEMKLTTTMTRIAYLQLREAAIAKSKLAEFTAWLKNRKIILLP